MPARPPHPRPCDSCPYRTDTPSGVWDADHYRKIAAYDLPTAEQSTATFMCHQNNGTVCAGWAGCHNRNPRGHELLALRIAMALGSMTAEDAALTAAYVSPVPLWSTGAEAAAHGLRDINQPSEEATWLRLKLLGRPHIREQSPEAVESLRSFEATRRYRARRSDRP
jgi:hypothetical protein